jgi:MSHA biogenesis protein MshK
MRVHLAMLIAWLPAAASFAQALADPTKPPQAGDFSMSSSGAAPSRGVLQSVMITGSTAEAIISGRVVRVGDRYDDVQVVKITEGEVVLRTTEGLQALKLYPGIETRYMDGKLPAASMPLKQVQSK